MAKRKAASSLAKAAPPPQRRKIAVPQATSKSKPRGKAGPRPQASSTASTSGALASVTNVLAATTISNAALPGPKTFLDLPNEILDSVFDFLLSEDDAIFIEARGPSQKLPATTTNPLACVKKQLRAVATANVNRRSLHAIKIVNKIHAQVDELNFSRLLTILRKHTLRDYRVSTDRTESKLHVHVGMNSTAAHVQPESLDKMLKWMEKNLCKVHWHVENASSPAWMPVLDHLDMIMRALDLHAYKRMYAVDLYTQIKKSRQGA